VQYKRLVEVALRLVHIPALTLSKKDPDCWQITSILWSTPLSVPAPLCPSSMPHLSPARSSKATSRTPHSRAHATTAQVCHAQQQPIKYVAGFSGLNLLSFDASTAASAGTRTGLCVLGMSLTPQVVSLHAWPRSPCRWLLPLSMPAAGA